MALIDKKSRTSIMYGVMICLFVAIVFCVIKIATRPPVVMDEDRANYYLPASEKIDFSELENQIAEKKEEVHIEVEDRARLIEDNRLEDLKRASKDIEYQNELLKEYDL